MTLFEEGLIHEGKTQRGKEVAGIDTKLSGDPKQSGRTWIPRTEVAGDDRYHLHSL
jgi:hypothetical protein